MTIDAHTLRNLDIFENAFDSTENGTLLKFLNFCLTPFGRRKLKGWIGRPLTKRQSIERRLDAQDDLYNNVLLRGK